MKNFTEKFLDANPELKKIEFIYVDFNGISRGKSASPKTLVKAASGGLKMPVSSYVLDIWGDNPKGTGLVMTTGDGDATCKVVENTLAVTPWSSNRTAQCLVSMEDNDGNPIYADPRNILKSVLNRFDELGLRPVIAPEMEFYLIDNQLTKHGHPQMPLIPGTNRRFKEVQLLNLNVMDDFEDFFDLVDKSAKSLGIPSETAIAECAPGQFEINLLHHDDPLLMADQAFLMKRSIKNCAKKFNLNATFMAKPFSEEAGNGMHAHLSIIDKKGDNLFKLDSSHQPQGIFADAIAGLLKTTPDFLSFYASHSNSYRRLVHNADHAPTTLSWGHENRTALIRIPESSPSATRLEFRLPSADSNPYLVFASILSSVLSGIQNKYPLSKETIGNAHAQHTAELGITWREAVEKTSKSKIVKDFFGEEFQKSFQVVKESEISRFESTVTDFEYNSYLRHL